MEILEVRPDDRGPIEGMVALENAANPVDAPWLHPTTLRELQGRMRYGWDLEPGRHFVVVDGGTVVAKGAVHTSEWDNRDLAWLGLTVHPAARGQGIGSRLFDHLCEVAGAMGRTKLGADAWDGTGGVGFLEARGFEPRSSAINRRQHLDEMPFEKIQVMYDEAKVAASAYELVRVTGRTPDELMPALAVLTASINDAPTDALDIEDEAFPPERISDYETATLGRGNRLYRLLARHRETGELAGHTVVVVEEERPALGDQHDTTVARHHRGRRLGLLLKTGMNLWLSEAEPQLETVDTWNAESNDHMIAVNEALGYRWMGREVQFQK